MDFAIFLSTENSVLRAVARVSSGTLNKEAPAFCRSHPHNLLIRSRRYGIYEIQSGFVAFKFLDI
jgi:hypothetical protein